MFYGLSVRKQLLERARRARTKYPLSRMSRVSAEIFVEETREVVAARVVLNDLSPDRVTVFLDRPLEAGEKISIVIEHPRHLYVRGSVQWCALAVWNQRVISADHFRYRAEMRFSFEFADDRKDVEDYCNSLASTPPIAI